jgi:hypothetical protein
MKPHHPSLPCYIQGRQHVQTMRTPMPNIPFSRDSHDPALINSDTRVLETRPIRAQLFEIGIHVREFARRSGNGRPARFQVDLEGHGIELLSTEGGEEFVLDHVGSRGEVGGEVERVQRVLGQEGEGPGRGGRVLVFLDDLRRIRKIQSERGSRLGNSAD